MLTVTVWVPSKIPPLLDISLYWNETTTYTAEIQLLDDNALSGGQQCLRDIRRFTWTMLNSVHGNRMSSDLDDFPILFSCDHVFEQGVIEGVEPASTLLCGNDNVTEHGLVRVKGQAGRPFVFSGVASSNYTASDDLEPEMIVTSFPKRRDFLHSLATIESQNAAYVTTQRFPISDCTMDRLPTRYAILAAFIPSIAHRIETALPVQTLQSSILCEVGISDPSLLAEAITAPSAGEVADYNRLEFLGDSILKFCTVLQVLAQHPRWPEGYLVKEKDRIVNNNNLAKAALRSGLGKFILTKPFTGRKWRPHYVSELLSVDYEDCRDMSSKVLADVVEALIGAAYLDGGLEKSFSCIRALLRDEKWHSREESISSLIEQVQPGKNLDLSLLQQLIGHRFSNPTLLLEAITHASCPQNQTGLSYERLEFLGDAVLDLIIVPIMFAHRRELKHWEFHRIREAVVNGNFLAFCCMNYAIEEDRFDVADGSIRSGTVPNVEKSTRLVRLHDFLRAGAQVMRDKRRAQQIFENLRHTIQTSLKQSSHYPWPDLIALQLPKFLSDMVESVLGAIYLDTQGDVSVCEAFLEKLGVLSHLRRILDEEVETAHPKEELGMLADREGVDYVVSKSEDVDGTKVFGCTVLVGEVEVSRVQGCGSREEAEARAAIQAVGVLEAKVVGEGSVRLRTRKLDS